MKILVKGGGSAGWLSASYLSLFHEVQIDIPKKSKPIGVGESTIPGFLLFLKKLGIYEYDIIAKCDGIIKKSIQHNNWHNNTWFHTFSGKTPYAYHLDALKLIELLEENCQHRLCTIDEPDLIIDCTGFKKTLTNINYKNLHNNRAVFAPGIIDDPTINYTRTYALDYGWSWNIILKSRSGNGYVFDKTYADDESILREFIENSPGKIKEKDCCFIDFTNSYNVQPWIDNTLKIGLSSGFIEPLEATGLYSICWQLETFQKCKDKNNAQKIYNRAWNRFIIHIHDFLQLYYRTSKNNHTEYWKSFEKVSVIPKYKFNYMFSDYSYNLLSKVSDIPYDNRTDTFNE